MTPAENRAKLTQVCEANETAGFGIAALEDVRTDDFLLPAATVGGLPFALSVALRVSEPVLATLEDHPNRLYEHHYRQVNFALDRFGLTLTREVEALGHRALPIPASQIVDWENQRAHMSHKRVAAAAGLGWLGRNNLLVTPEHGAQVRLVTVLTDLPLEPDSPLDQDCGACHACIRSCPANAIADDPADFDHRACFATLKRFQKERHVSQYICGLCVKACRG